MSTKNGRIQMIYADPPWPYDNVRTGGSLTSGASQKYDVMTMDEIRGLAVGSVCEPDAVCAMWATVPMLPEALSTLRAWGFQYKTLDVWVKADIRAGIGEDGPGLHGRLGLGHWFRGTVELVLYGVRGSVPAPRTGLRNVFFEAPTLHSRKPRAARARVEKVAEACFGPEWQGLELFAREQAPRWTTVGNEIDGADVATVLHRIRLAQHGQGDLLAPLEG